MTGKIQTPEHRRKIGLKQIGNKHALGIKQSKDVIEKRVKKIKEGYKNGRISFFAGKFGKDSPSWIPDRTKLKKSDEKRTSAYNYWRKQVWERDKFKCKISNEDCKGRLEAHHILPWRDYPELRYEINNGITLCHVHHPRKRTDEAKLSPYFQSLLAEMN